MDELNQTNSIPRREFIRKSVELSGAAFVMSVGSKVPLPQLTQHRAPNQPASRVRGNNGVGNGQDPQPRGNPPINDGPGTGPGNPGRRRGG